MRNFSLCYLSTSFIVVPVYYVAGVVYEARTGSCRVVCISTVSLLQENQKSASRMNKFTLHTGQLDTS